MSVRHNQALNLESEIGGSEISFVAADLTTARQLLLLEAEAVRKLAEQLDDSFSAAISLLANAKGRIIVTGMGKSGHVARKLAATFAGTGTAASFVHPAEASHGDLGMVTEADVVVAFSNSGNTIELGDIIAHTRRYNVPLIGITSRSDSALGQAADVVLYLPNVPEACPLGLAPTSSTTMMLALGDALAVALFERRDFSASDFKRLHPGGTLGKKLLKVADLMHKAEALPLCAPTQKLRDVIMVISAKSFGCVGVVDAAGKLLGVITDGDLRRALSKKTGSDDILAQDAQSLMSKNPLTIEPSVLAAEALAQMNERKITALFAVTDNVPVGILHIHDCLRAGVG